MGLKRSPGAEYPVAFSPVLHDPGRIHDVNGYYDSLGLVGPGGSVLPGLTQRDVVAAYRRRFAVLHPDRGEWDYEAWEQVECAKECLSDLTKKVRYDALVPPMKWRDRIVDRQIAEAGAATPTEARVTTGQSVRYRYYYDCSVEPPVYEIVLGWLERAAYAYHLRRMPGPVRLGFTGGDAHILVRPWGEVLMVPVTVEPSMEAVLRCLDSQ